MLALGFALGLRHALDADHLVAVSTIVSRQKKFGGAWILGAFWGAGHCATIFFVGLAVIAFKVVIPARLGLAMEFCVGLLLIALGVFNLARRSSLAVHSHAHAHDDASHDHQTLLGEHSPVHEHLHVHAPALGRLARLLKEAGPAQALRALLVGVVHGLAGSAAVALLVLATIGGARASAVYLLVFGLGTMAGMLLLSAAMEFFFLHLTRRSAENAMALATGLVSLAFGLYMVYRIGFVDGLIKS